MTEEARKVFEAKIKYGMELSTISCSMLVNEYCLLGRMDKAKKVFNFLVALGHVPDIASCYNALVNGYVQDKRMGEALRLAKEMIQKGLRPDIETQKSLKGFRCRRHVASA
ncbi:PREDICTED: pentatricopeptide [Prunus dulcis]|uniref:PREDICTED: pentatricopeptide n=1 Tax=Prunus dulcis TaxID=3755 RepID=A0A5E4G365_PRUDU|nr:PREDICTED: pentatricopeptide [Prunus dulcis]